MNIPLVGSVVALIVGGAVLLQPGMVAAEPTNWNDVQQECREAGIESKLIRDIIARCREAKVEPDSACLMLKCVKEAASEGLPCEPVMEKIAEGVGKGIPPATVAEVAFQRVRLLRVAREMLRSVHHDLAARDVIIAAAQAMESGLQQDATRSVIEAGRNERPADLAALIEAGETLCLAGFSSDEVPPILADCVERHLNRLELRRAVRYASQQRQRGMETGRIREALWGAEGGAAQNRHREQNGQGGGAGPGPGGPHHGHGRP